MKEQILSNLNNPGQLERLYRADKSTFKQAFKALYPELKDNTLIGFWHERLQLANEEISWGTGKDLLFVAIAALLGGFIAKLPAIFHIDEYFFYPRNICFMIFPAFTAYFAWKNKLSAGKIAFIAGITIVSIFFINFLPVNNYSDTVKLSYIHLALVLWSISGFAFVGEQRNNVEKRLAFLKYNGDLIVMTTLIVIAGAILTGITIGLFSLLHINIEKFYFENIVVFALPAVPVVANYLIRTNPQLVGKVSPVIAKIFSPLVLVMLIVYLSAMAFSGKDPYNDPEFLLIFNGLLVGVMAIIFFSVAGTSNSTKSRTETWILFLLSIVTIIANGVALSAISFRISAWGFTPNRTAVLGSNLLVLINLLLVTAQLFQVLTKKKDITGVGKVISFFLPFYFAWAIIVTFIFPFIFGFK
jgi:hypothetical protein